MNLNENNAIKEANITNKVNNKKSYHHQSTTPYKNYQHNQHKTPKDKFRPLGFSSPYHQSSNTENSGSTPYTNQFRSFQDSNRKNYGNNNRNNYNRNSKNANRDENISQYFHPSMLEDPWKKLEDQARKVKQKSPESSGSDSNPPSDS